MTVNTETRQRVNENGRVVIPASFRKALGINIGDEVVLRMEDDELRITTLKRRVERAQRLVADAPHDRHIRRRRERDVRFVDPGILRGASPVNGPTGPRWICYSSA